MLKRIAFAVILAVVAVQAAAAQVPPEVSEWIRAFFAAYTARDIETLRVLFTPEAFVGRSSVDKFLNAVQKGSDLLDSFSVSPRGEPEVRRAGEGYAVRQPAVRMFTSKENGLRYRHLVTYNWTLITRDRLLAMRMNIVDEPEPNLPVGKVQVSAFPEREGGGPANTPQKVFRPQDSICLVITSNEVQGGHYFTVQLTSPDGYEHPLRGLFGLGTADQPGPLLNPVWGCLRTPRKGWQQGTWKAEVFVEGYVRGRTEWEVRP